MKKRSLSFAAGVMVVGVFVLSFVFSNPGACCAEGKTVLKKYPTLKIGFTTTNFLNVLPIGVDNKKKLIDYAAEQGYAWIELRDPNADLTLAQCQELAAYANAKSIQVAYAIQKGLLDPTFWETFARALPNAVVFEGPRTIRCLGCGPEFFKDSEKKTWTLEELYNAVKTANVAGNKAKEFGLQLVVENALEALKGDGISGFGLTEFFANVNSNVGWQLDTANLFAVSRVHTDPSHARQFVEENISNMFYIHLKTSSTEHKVLPYLDANELDFNIVFELMQKNGIPWVAIELARSKSLEEAKMNHEKSVKYLIENY